MIQTKINVVNDSNLKHQSCQLCMCVTFSNKMLNIIMALAATLIIIFDAVLRSKFYEEKLNPISGKKGPTFTAHPLGGESSLDEAPQGTRCGWEPHRHLCHCRRDTSNGQTTGIIETNSTDSQDGLQFSRCSTFPLKIYGFIIIAHAVSGNPNGNLFSLISLSHARTNFFVVQRYLGNTK